MKSVLIGILSAVVTFVILTACMGFTNTSTPNYQHGSLRKMNDNGVIEVYEYDGLNTRVIVRDKSTGHVACTN